MNIDKKSIYILLILALMSSICRGNKGDKLLFFNTLNVINSIQVLSYEANIDVTFPNGKKEQSKLKYAINKPLKQYFLENEERTFLLSDTWLMQAYHFRKKVSIFNIKTMYSNNNNIQSEIHSLFNDNIISGVMDTSFIKSIAEISITNLGSIQTFKVKFENLGLREMILEYDIIKKIPQKLAFRLDRYLNMDNSYKGIDLQSMYVVCKNYSTISPSGVFDFSKYFTAKNNKIQLLKYKNYQLFNKI